MTGHATIYAEAPAAASAVRAELQRQDMRLSRDVLQLGAVRNVQKLDLRRERRRKVADAAQRRSAAKRLAGTEQAQKGKNDV